MGQFQAGQGDAGKHLRGRVLCSQRLNFRTSARGGKVLLPAYLASAPTSWAPC